MTSREICAERRRLERAGFRVTVTGGNHLKIMHPVMIGPVFMSSTPSDRRAIRNLRATLRRRMAVAQTGPAE
jgi:hypothetical protein